jgi:DNA-binding transcriptional regulator YiaG
MNLAIASHSANIARVIVAVPSESGSFPLKAFFASALIACSSTSAQAATVAPVRIDSTSAGVAIGAREKDINPSTADALDEIKRRSGLTWGQLARIFNVSRRTVHSWANGAAVRVGHIGLVTQLLERVREFDDQPSFKVRDRLLGLSVDQTNAKPLVTDESPILVGDNTPFVHHLERRPGKINVRRG